MNSAAQAVIRKVAAMLSYRESAELELTDGKLMQEFICEPFLMTQEGLTAFEEILKDSLHRFGEELYTDPLHRFGIETGSHIIITPHFKRHNFKEGILIVEIYMENHNKLPLP